MFKIYFGLALAGMISFLFLSLAKYNRETKSLSFKETIKDYFNPAITFSLVAQLIIQTVFTFLLTIDGGGWLIKTFTGGQIPETLPIGFYAFAFLCGFGGNALSVILGKMVQADQYAVRGERDKVEEFARLEKSGSSSGSEEQRIENKFEAIENRFDRDCIMIDPHRFIQVGDPVVNIAGIVYSMRKVTELMGCKMFGIDPNGSEQGKMGDYIGQDVTGQAKIFKAKEIEGIQG